MFFPLGRYIAHSHICKLYGKQQLDRVDAASLHLDVTTLTHLSSSTFSPSQSLLVNARFSGCLKNIYDRSSFSPVHPFLTLRRDATRHRQEGRAQENRGMHLQILPGTPTGRLPDTAAGIIRIKPSRVAKGAAGRHEIYKSAEI